MAFISLRLVSVIICVALTLITAVLTLAVSLSFTKKAVDRIGLQYSSALATNLQATMTGYLQAPVNQYFAGASLARTSTMALPNTTWTPGWNGSFWTFNTADLHSVEPYAALQMEGMFTHNFTREVMGLTCFEDGTFAQIRRIANGSTLFQVNIYAGKPDGSLISRTAPSYVAVRTYDFDYQPLTREGTPVYTPTCTQPAGCGTLDCRTLAPSIVMRPFGPKQCLWISRHVALWPSISTGVYCTMFNSAGLRVGMTGGEISLVDIQVFVASTQRTANGQVFAVDWPGLGLLGSTVSKPYQRAWTYVGATFDPSAYALRNTSAAPIVMIPTTTTDRFTSPQMNATYIAIPKACQNGLNAPYIVCQEFLTTYGYEPLIDLHHQVGVNPNNGFQQGSIVSQGKAYYYAIDAVSTSIAKSTVPGLLWATVVLTPEEDVLAEVTRGRTYAIVATCCFFVFSAACCFAAFTYFLRPLRELEEKMIATANLDDQADCSEELSSLSEIASMQGSFYRLRAQLRKLKTYVPQSVLACLYDNDGDDDEDADVEGNVTVMDVGRSAASDPRGRDGATSREKKSGDGQTSARSHSSRGSRSSLSSSIVLSSGVVVRTLNMQLGLVKKVVSVVAFNVLHMHEAVASHTPDELLTVHARLLSSFHSIVTEAKGVVDGFQGDRFVATFNAVTSNAQHAVRAAVAAQELVAAFEKNRKWLMGAGVGIASGDALVGNMGSDALRRFCTVGRVYTQATVLERLTKQYDGANIIISAATARQVAHEFYVETLDVVELEGSSKPMGVVALRNRMSHAMEEWNYAMEANASRDLFSGANRAFEAYLGGDAAAARAMLQEVAAASQDAPGYRCLKGLLERNTYAADRAAEQGRFFRCSYGPHAAAASS